MQMFYFFIMFVVFLLQLLCSHTLLEIFSAFPNVFNQSIQCFTLLAISCSFRAATTYPYLREIFTHKGELSVTQHLPKRLFYSLSQRCHMQCYQQQEGSSADYALERNQITSIDTNQFQEQSSKNSKLRRGELKQEECHEIRERVLQDSNAHLKK